MRTTSIACFVVAAFALSIQPHTTFGQNSRNFTVDFKNHGSVPPIRQWFSCASELRAYDKIKAQECLTSMLSHPEILKGRFALHHYKKSDVLTFYLESPTLIVTDVDLGVSAGELAKVHDLLAINGNALSQGEQYDFYKEASSWLVLDLLSRSRGHRAGVSSTVRLDYSRKTAQVVFKIWEGPPGESEPLLPPYAEPCPIMNGNFGWIDVDDLTPVSYIQRQMKIKWLGCFSEGDLRDDEAQLKQMAFLKDSKISVRGSGHSRDFSFYFRSNPIPITKVTVHGYGLLSALSDADIPQLLVHASDNYSRSRAREVEDSLKNAFAKDNLQVKVFTDVEVSSVGEATLDFSVLAYPDDVVYINGQAFDTTRKKAIQVLSVPD